MCQITTQVQKTWNLQTKSQNLVILNFKTFLDKVFAVAILGKCTLTIACQYPKSRLSQEVNYRLKCRGLRVWFLVGLTAKNAVHAANMVQMWFKLGNVKCSKIRRMCFVFHMLRIRGDRTVTTTFPTANGLWERYTFTSASTRIKIKL